MAQQPNAAQAYGRARTGNAAQQSRAALSRPRRTPPTAAGCRSGPLAIMTQQPNASEAEAAKLAEWGKRLQEIGGKCNRFEQELLKEVPSVRSRFSPGAAASHACACVRVLA
jgi:hypothetical protein